MYLPWSELVKYSIPTITPPRHLQRIVDFHAARALEPVFRRFPEFADYMSHKYDQKLASEVRLLFIYHCPLLSADRVHFSYLL